MSEGLSESAMGFISRGEPMPDEMFEAWIREPCQTGDGCPDPRAHLMAIHARTLFETRRARRGEQLQRERGDMWKVRAEQSEAEKAEMRRLYEGKKP